ncbi:patatin-like phospholipase family protein [Pontibacter sp. 172403-2]|uniref:patatin-like phospholipase family protein n=1 Tax=Pontibacter rufus TaxID=2791028 RepID=UPI0018AF70EA|nr:patatin-like phospholipase family protein [Pontibacter sp. 172403-2]MBF9255442.1 patatin-like phospholipase family protein [Pontibacter sp. 172403-2]
MHLTPVQVWLLLCCWLLFAAPQANAQQSGIEPCPKVGLVLSGGGAKGMAHIGFLKVLEEAGIRPDYITGTSMGALVGALYAMGYSAAEIEKIALDINWNKVLSNEISLDKVAMEEKDYFGRYIVELPLEHYKLGFPSGMIEGQALAETFSRLTRSAHGINDFSKLPIPFACVATDLLTGEKVVLKSGSLPEAMRASMAIPSVFTPVRIGDRLLVDGGMVQNFPVQEALDMGADIIIGVNVSGALEPEESLTSMLNVLVQIAFFTSSANTYEEKLKTDFLVEMQDSLQQFSTGSFGRTAEIIKMGESVSRLYLDSLKTLADSLNAYGPPPPPVQHIAAADSVYVESITITGARRVPKKLITGKLHIREQDTLALEQIEDNVEELYGTRHFDKVSYTLQPGPKGYHLQVQVKEAPPSSVKAAVFYDSENHAGVTVNLTQRNLLLSGSRFIAEADVAQMPRVDLNYLKYLGRLQNVAAVLGASYYGYEFPTYNQNNNKIAVLNKNRYAGYAGWQSTSHTNWTFGQRLSFYHLRLSPEVAGQFILNGSAINANIIRKLKNSTWGLSTFYQLNNLNSAIFPTKGWKVDATAEGKLPGRLQANLLPEYKALQDSISSIDYQPYIRLTVKSTGFIPIRPNLSLVLRQGLIFYNTENVPPDQEVYAGGFRPIVPDAFDFRGMKPYTYALTKALYFDAGLQLRIKNNLYIHPNVQALNVSLLNSDRLLQGQGLRISYGLMAGYDSPLGPVVLGVALQHKSSIHGYLGLGFRLPRY